eukprot:gene8877-1228_t
MKVIGQFFEALEERKHPQVLIPHCHRAVISANQNRLLLSVDDSGELLTYNLDSETQVPDRFDVGGRVKEIVCIERHNAVAVLFDFESSSCVKVIQAWNIPSQISSVMLPIVNIQCMSACPVLGNLAVAKGNSVDVFAFGKNDDSNILSTHLFTLSTQCVVGRVALCLNFIAYASPSQVEVVSVDLKAQCNSDSTVFKASQSDITKDSSPVVTENEITLSFEVKRLRYLTPEFIDFPALDPTRKQTQQDMVPTSSTPLVSTRVMHICVKVQDPAYICSCVTMHLRFKTEELDTLSLLPAFRFLDECLLSETALQAQVQPKHDKPLEADHSHCILSECIDGVYAIHTGAHKGFQYHIHKEYSSLTTTYSFALPESAQTCCFNSTRMFITTTGSITKLYTFTLQLQRLTQDDEEIDPDTSVLWLSSTNLEHVRVLRASASDNLYGIVAVHVDMDTTSFSEMTPSSDSPPSHGGSALQVLLYKVPSTATLYRQIHSFSQTLPTGHPNVVMAIRECNLVLRTQLLTLSLGGAASSHHPSHAAFLETRNALQESFEVIGQLALCNSKIENYRSFWYFLLSPQKIESLCQLISQHSGGSDERANSCAQIILSLYNSDIFYNRCEDPQQVMKILGDSLSVLPDHEWHEAITLILENSTLFNHLQLGASLKARLKQTKTLQASLLCGIITAPTGHQALTSGFIEHWQKHLQIIEEQYGKTLWQQLRLHPEMCIQICERGERIYACPLFYVTFVGNLGNAADIAKSMDVSPSAIIHLIGREVLNSYICRAVLNLVSLGKRSHTKTDWEQIVATFVSCKAQTLAAPESCDTTSRFGWLDHLPPYAPGLTPGVGGSAAALHELKQLQAFCCLYLTPVISNLIMEQLAQFPEFPGMLSLRLLCLRSRYLLKEAADLIIGCHPRILPEFFSCSNECTPEVLTWTLQKLYHLLQISSDRTSSDIIQKSLVESYEHAYIGILNMLACRIAVTDIQSLMDILPANLDLRLALPFLRKSCQISMSTELLKKILQEATEGSEQLDAS